MDNKSYKNLLMKRSLAFSLNTMRLVDTLPRNVYSYEVIARQLMRSATSVGANIVEAQAGSSRKDFTNFIQIALKSANETNYWLSLLNGSGKVHGKMLDDLVQESLELSKILGSTVSKLRSVR